MENGDATKLLENCSWSFLKAFSVKRDVPAHVWNWINELLATAPVEPSLRRYKVLMKEWNSRLRDLGGDPSAIPWSAFRPLRLSREEDWSDWLAWLFMTSAEGEFAWRLFGRGVGQSACSLRKPGVLREAPSEDQARRADILLIWERRLGIHIEVKVGDEQFGKTSETGRLHREMQKVKEWRDFVLIPEWSLGAWDENVRADPSGNRRVEVLLWKDVARALRRCLWSKRESKVWRMWGWTLCGAIEQKLLGLTSPHTVKSAIGQFNVATRWAELLTLEKRRRK